MDLPRSIPPPSSYKLGLLVYNHQREDKQQVPVFSSKPKAPLHNHRCPAKKDIRRVLPVISPLSSVGASQLSLTASTLPSTGRMVRRRGAELGGACCISASAPDAYKHSKSQNKEEK